MSGVESIRPRLGVRSVFSHGSGLPHIGIPLMTCCVEARPTGAKMITSYFDRRSAVWATVCVLM